MNLIGKDFFNRSKSKNNTQNQESPLGKDFESLAEHLIQAQEITGIASWIYYVEKDEFYRSEEVCRIFGIDPSNYPKNMDDHIKLAHPDDKAKVENAVYEALKGTPTDIVYRIPKKIAQKNMLEVKELQCFW